MKKTTFGVIIGTRGFFPASLAVEGRKLLLATLEQLGFDYVITSEDATPYGAVETLADARITAKLFRENYERIDGIIILSTFPCGPDSMVNEIVIRRVKDKPILNLILDGQEGTAGLETRLESFIDIIKYKRNESVG